MDGIIVINKPKGITSREVVNKVCKLLNTKKVGHTGTLDPIATGVLVLCVGKATKLVETLTSNDKEYVATVKLGILTDTLDTDGTIIEKKCVNLDKDKLVNVLNSFIGTYNQEVPIYSAVKINGKKLYEYARENKEVEIKERPIKIYELEAISDLYYEDGYLALKLRMKVSKGFYVRSLVRDLANELNTIGIMSDLVRIQTGDFNILNSKKLSEISCDDLMKIEDVFSKYPRFNARPYLVPLIKNGIMLDERQMTCDCPFTVYFEDKLLAIYAPKDDRYYRVQYFGDSHENN